MWQHTRFFSILNSGKDRRICKETEEIVSSWWYVEYIHYLWFVSDREKLNGFFFLSCQFSFFMIRIWNRILEYMHDWRCLYLCISISISKFKILKTNIWLKFNRSDTLIQTLLIFVFGTNRLSNNSRIFRMWIIILWSHYQFSIKDSRDEQKCALNKYRLSIHILGEI